MAGDLLHMDRLRSAELGVSSGMFGELVVIVDNLRNQPDDAFDRWVTQAGVDLFVCLRTALVESTDPPSRLCVVVVEPNELRPSDVPALEAAVAAVRGAVLSLAVEHPESLLTTVRARDRDWAALSDTLEFLASEDASYVTGASLDIRSRS